MQYFVNNYDNNYAQNANIFEYKSMYILYI